MQPYYGYPPPPPPPRKSNTAVIVASVVGGIALLLAIGIPFAIGVTKGVRRASAPPPPAATVAPGLTEVYTSKNGLLTAHYPPDFVAKNVDGATLGIARKLADGSDEEVVIAAVPSPITDDVHEFARLLTASIAKKVAATGDTFVETTRRDTACFGGYDGVNVEGNFLAGGRTRYLTSLCFFMHDDRGYEIEYIVSEARAPSEMPLLQSIATATQFAR